MSSAPPFNWAADTDLSKAQEIVRLGELVMEDVRELATSGDSRAATLAAAMSAVAAGIFVAAVTILGFAKYDTKAVYALFASAAIFVLSSGLAILSAAPADFYVRGFYPKSLAETIGDELQIAKWVAEDIAKKLDANRKVLNKQGRMLIACYFTAAAGVILPLLVSLYFTIYR